MPPTADDPVLTLTRELDALAKAYSLGHHGRWAAHRRADLVDRCLTALFARSGAPEGVALVALGGYGRRLQLPASDIDLLIVHEGLGDDDVQRVVDVLLYPLWDAGLTIGQAVRTPAQCLEAAGQRLDTWTAMLDGRPLAGDTALVSRALDPVRALASRDPAGFARRLTEARVARRERAGSCAHLLEPHLKDGIGGLRDVATLGWLATAVGASLQEAGLAADRELAAVDAAEEFLVRARSAVHLETGKRGDRLLVDLQADVARGFGFTDEPRLPAPDGLMRAIFEHARNVEFVVNLVLARVAEPAERSPEPEPLLDGPLAVLRILAALAEAGTPVSPDVVEAVAAAPVPDPVTWTAEVREVFLRLLRTGEAAAPMLDVLDRLGLLARFLPCWVAVRCRPQRDPYHRFTVDTHLVTAAAHVASIVRAVDAGEADERHTEMVNLIEHRDGLLLGALLHDVGKVGEGKHVPIGAEIAAAQLGIMHLDEADRELAVFMVAEHLLLPDTATRRDLTDEDLLIDVAAKVATPERLAALAVLAEADAAATGPAAGTPWRQTLLRELVTKVGRVFERGEMGVALAATLADRVGRVRDLLESEPEADVDRFVLRMPRGYFLSVEPTRVSRHFHTIAPSLGALEVRTASAEGSRAGAYEVLVVAADRPGLLSWIAGALALGGISILSAQVFTTEDGAAIDLFEVQGAFDPEITEARWREFRSALRRAIEGAISLERRVEEKRRRYPAPRVPAPVTVAVDNDASEFSTVIEVGASDRIGLLHDITRAFAELHLDVHLAKVATFDGRVVDAFYIRDALGRKIVDPGQLAEIERTLRDRLAPTG